MIWYVATLIASVISTRGLAAQGELKCSAPALPSRCSQPLPPHLPLPGPSERRACPRARLQLRLGGLRPGTAGRAGAAGRRSRRQGVPVLGLPGTREKTPWDRGRLRPPSAPHLHTGPCPASLAGAAVSWSAGESAAPLTLGAGSLRVFGRLLHSRHRSQTSPRREVRPRALGLLAPTAKGLGYWPCGRPPLQLAPLLTPNLGSQRSGPSPRAGGAWRT